ncbi:MAG: adenylate/guanylate cyclase domain-containing protein [Flavobacteriales bacterium]
MARPLSRSGRRLRRTLRVTLAWVALAAFTTVHETGMLAAHGLAADLGDTLLRHVLKAVAGGVVIGGSYIFFLHDRLRNVRLLPAYGIVVAFIAAGITVFAGTQGFGPGSLMDAGVHFLDLALLMGGTMVMLRINDQYGGGNALHLLGRFIKPRQQLRIFMFLDMRSSTSVAERIGDTRYFRLLNDLFNDITDPVVYSEGEIYQYVGDEISVSWGLERGVRNDRCIRCFFAIRAKLHQRSAHYQKHYGIEPVFKAGFHVGRVTTGEVGVLKRQTIFSGDVVNTAAHIQASCNALGVDNLMSKDLYDVLSLRPDRFMVRPMGSIPLKGKRTALELFTISLSNDPQ